MINRGHGRKITLIRALEHRSDVDQRYCAPVLGLAGQNMIKRFEHFRNGISGGHLLHEPPSQFIRWKRNEMVERLALKWEEHNAPGICSHVKDLLMPETSPNILMDS